MRKVLNSNRCPPNNSIQKSESMQHESNLRKPQPPPPMKQKPFPLSNFTKQFKHSTHESIAISVDVDEATVGEELQEVAEEVLVEDLTGVQATEVDEVDETQATVTKDRDCHTILKNIVK